MKAEDIVLSKRFRQDYDEYLMGQRRQIDIAKDRNLKLHQVVKAFNILLQEKIELHNKRNPKPTQKP